MGRYHNNDDIDDEEDNFQFGLTQKRKSTNKRFSNEQGEQIKVICSNFTFSQCHQSAATENIPFTGLSENERTFYEDQSLGTYQSH